jgi:hypothetical protein
MINAIDRAGRGVAMAGLIGLLAAAPVAAWAAGPQQPARLQQLAQSNTAPVGPAAAPASPAMSPPAMSPGAPAAAAPAPVSAAPAEGAPAPAASSETTSSSPAMPADAQVTRRIAELKKRLGITRAEMPQFDAFANVMRENAQQMDMVLQKRSQVLSMNAVEDLKSYAELTEAHAQALQRMVPAFQALYASLSPAQQHRADTLLGRVKARAQHETRRKAG